MLDGLSDTALCIYLDFCLGWTPYGFIESTSSTSSWANCLACAAEVKSMITVIIEAAGSIDVKKNVIVKMCEAKSYQVSVNLQHPSHDMLAPATTTQTVFLCFFGYLFNF